MFFFRELTRIKWLVIFYLEKEIFREIEENIAFVDN